MPLFKTLWMTFYNSLSADKFPCIVTPVQREDVVLGLIVVTPILNQLIILIPLTPIMNYPESIEHLYLHMTLVRAMMQFLESDRVSIFDSFRDWCTWGITSRNSQIMNKYQTCEVFLHSKSFLKSFLKYQKSTILYTDYVWNFMLE